MATDLYIEQLEEALAMGNSDLFPIVVDPSGSAETKKIKKSNVFKGYLYTTVGTDTSAEHVCDGVDDNIQIQEALDAVEAAGGGVVFIQQGTYIISSPVEYGSNTILSGAGRGATVIKQVDSGTITASYGLIQPKGYPYDGVDDLPLVTNATVTHLSVDGNSANNTGAYECVVMIGVDGGLLHDIETYGATEVGINTNSTDYFYPSTNVDIEPVIVSNCFMHDNNEGCQIGPGTYVGNFAYRNTGHGFDLVSAFNVGPTSSAVLSGCVSYSNQHGFITQFQYDSTAFPVAFVGCSAVLNTYTGFNLDLNNSSVSGCVVMLNSEDGIRVHGDHISIVGNLIKNNGYGTGQSAYAGYSGIQFFEDCNDVTISGNQVFDDQAVKTQLYGIGKSYILGSGSTNIAIYDNDLYGNSTEEIISDVVALTGASIRNNVGFTTENSGTATVANGATTVDVTHGLSATPTVDDITVTPTNSMGNSTKFYISNPTSTKFTITVDVDPGATTATFAWRANIL